MNRSERKKVIKMHKSKKTGRKTLDEALDSYQKKIDSDGEIKDHPSEGIITDMVMRRHNAKKQFLKRKF